MDTFLFCLILTFAVALGGREQLIIAQFADQAGKTVPLLFTGAFCAALTAAIMAYVGAGMAAILPQRAADMLVAFALGIAAVELLWPVRMKTMREPTRSLVAIGAVVFVRQAMDAPRFLIFAFAAAATYPTTAMIGGALGGGAAVILGWSVGLAQLQRFPLRAIRSGMAACMIVAALFIGLNARYTFL